MSGVLDDGNKSKTLSKHVQELENTVKKLEINLKQSTQADGQVMMSLQSDKIKYQGLSNQLEEALKENQQLLDILQQKSGENDLSRANSQGDLNSSCSTMSIVHLQYKYEELLSSHRGLLKLLEVKSDEIRKILEENTRLKTEMEPFKLHLSEAIAKYEKLRAKFQNMKEKKDEKIRKLKTHKETLQMVHNQLVDALHNQCMEKDQLLSDEIKSCGDSDRALLLQEIRKNNMLAYENFQLTQRVEFLRSLLHSGNKSDKST